jgi:N-acyl homoserine lactone hydrolase
MATEQLGTRHQLEHLGNRWSSAPTSVQAVHVLDLGSLQIDRSVMSYGLGLASVEDQARPADWVTIPLYAVLVETSDARILFDTGTHPDSKSRWAESLQPYEYLVASEEQFLPQRLEAIDLRPEDIDIAVLSHLHMDHSGAIEFLTNAEVFVHRDELRNALEHYARTDGSPAYVKEDVAAWIKTGVKWAPIDRSDGDLRIAPGVTVLNFGAGHTDGDLGLMVEMPDSRLLVLAGDACYNSVNLGPPTVLPGSNAFVDSQGLMRTAHRLRRLITEERATVWFGHDPEQYSKLVKAPAGFYA